MKPALQSSLPIVAILVLAGALVGCESAPVVAPPPTAAAGSDKPAVDNQLTYIIEPTDVLTMAVDGQSDLNVQGSVRADGTFGLIDLTEPIKLAGLTIDEAQKRIEQAYKDGHILRNPKVRLNIYEAKKRQVIIEGHVKAPAHYNIPIETSMTVLDLISQAGGFDEYAKGTVNITHTDRNGKSEQRTIDVNAILHGDKGAMKIDDPRLLVYPGDLVYAPESIL